MDNTYNPHDNVAGAYGHGRTAWYTHDGVGSNVEVMVWGQSETFTHKGCDMTLKTEDDKRATTMTDIYSVALYRFNLRDIDPSSVKVQSASHLGGFPCEGHTQEQLDSLGMNCDHAAMGFSAHSEAGLISEEFHTTYRKLTGADHESNKSDRTGRAFFVFNDVEYANRFAKAFVRAIQLCGGKPSPF